MIDKNLLLGDADIRPELRTRLARRHGRHVDTAIVEELGLRKGLVRVDIAVVNGAIHGYEIKSDRDSLRRLAGQVEIYGSVLDRATLVVGERHFATALEIVPDWWGVLRVSPSPSRPKFQVARQGKENPRRDVRALAELLWLGEAVALLEGRGLARGVRGKPRHAVWDRLCEHFDLDEIAFAVRQRLKSRARLKGPE